MKTPVFSFHSFFLFSFLLLLASCKKVDSGTPVPTPSALPVLSTSAISDLSISSVTAGGLVTSDGGKGIISRGLCWDTKPEPDIASPGKISLGSGTGSFACILTGLNPATEYYLRAWATNASGTAYGNQIRFTTPVSNTLGIENVLLPADTFMMGSPESEELRFADEVQHQVSLHAFRMSRYEINNEQFAAFLNEKGIGADGVFSTGAYPSKILVKDCDSLNGLNWTGAQWQPKPGFENHPVVCVSWFGAIEFARYAGGRLPTEAEWEYACRAGTSTPFSTGNCLNFSEANYLWELPYSGCSNANTNSPRKTKAVNSFGPNLFGLFNMHGNALEWCNDWRDSYSELPQNNPSGPLTGRDRVVRGGCMEMEARYCRSAYRSASNPADISHTVGFRLVFAP